MTVELDYICDVCGRPVDDGCGVICISFAAVREYRAAKADREQDRVPARVVEAPTLLGGLDPVPWLIHHGGCASVNAEVYDIPVECVRSWRALLSWTARLLGKGWLPVTNWASVIGDAAEGRSERIAEHVRGDAA